MEKMCLHGTITRSFYKPDTDFDALAVINSDSFSLSPFHFYQSGSRGWILVVSLEALEKM